MTDAEALLARARQNRRVIAGDDHESRKAEELARIYGRAARRVAQADLFRGAA